MKTRLNFLHELRPRLTALLPEEREVRGHCHLIIDHLFGMSYYQFMDKPDEPVDPAVYKTLNSICAGLSEQAPIQYLLGEVEFFGHRFRVTPDVLIPRPETEQLCRKWLWWVPDADDPAPETSFVNRNPTTYRLLDLGTGSGVIAISFALASPSLQVDAIDISPEALAVARENAQRLGAKVNFIEADFYTWTPEPEAYDSIVSNPPYIPEREASSLSPRVRYYEPSIALFVPDEDPLRPYRRIVELAVKGLRYEGLLILEVHESFAEEVLKLVQDAGFYYPEIVHDFADKPRFVQAAKLRENHFRYGIF